MYGRKPASKIYAEQISQSMPTILVTGAFGQVGTDLVAALGRLYGSNSVIASDVAEKPQNYPDVRFAKLDVTRPEEISNIIKQENVTDVFHLAAILSATGEKKPYLTYEINMNGTFNILKESVQGQIDHVIIPSSMAVFGRGIDRTMVNASSPAVPETMYGISKVTAELLGKYFYKKFGLDVRGLRYPGLISYAVAPTAGTTDYAVDMFIHAIAEKPYTCYLREDTIMPMMYMPDAIDSLIKLFRADPERLVHRTDYNIASFSFSPKDLENALLEYFPEMKVTYVPDSRQDIADGWPMYLDSSEAVEEWGFAPEYDMEATVRDMVENLRKMSAGRK